MVPPIDPKIPENIASTKNEMIKVPGTPISPMGMALKINKFTIKTNVVAMKATRIP